MSTLTLASRYHHWPDATENAKRLLQLRMADLFAADSNRADRYTVNGAGLTLDYSKNFIDEAALNTLLELAREAGLAEAIVAMFAGDAVNNTEDRPALHCALRHTAEAETDEHRAVEATIKKMTDLVERVHGGQWVGHTGARIQNVVNIGIGGSDLGPRMVCKALTPYCKTAVQVHFVANVDGSELHDTLGRLDPASTLFIVASKSFSTQETLENALSARRWILDSGCPSDQLKQHFVAISSKIDKAVEFGIEQSNVYPIWDWVGGRYSLWSAIGLPIAMALGMEGFNELRAGAHAMDMHFAETPLEKNIPVLMGLLMFWYTQFMSTTTQAVLPYSHHLGLLPTYLQQLEMESNGKSVTRDGARVDYPTGAIVWGTEGTNGQHSFHQLLHQGTVPVPIDFIAILNGHSPYDHQHRLLFANCVAQSQALLTGRDLATATAELQNQGFKETDVQALAPHKVHPGNRPSNTMLLQKLTPHSLGALIAAYEHKVYVIATMLQINPFDQWGVELGKLLGTHVNTAIETTDIPGDWDSSTRNLIRRFCAAND